MILGRPTHPGICWKKKTGVVSSLCPYRSLRIPGRAFPGQDTVFPSITMCCLSSKISDHLGGAVPITVPVLLSWWLLVVKGEFQDVFFLSGNRETGSDYSLAMFVPIFSPPSLGLILVQMITKSHHQCQLWQKSAGTGGPSLSRFNIGYPMVPLNPIRRYMFLPQTVCSHLEALRLFWLGWSRGPFFGDHCSTKVHNSSVSKESLTQNMSLETSLAKVCYRVGAVSFLNCVAVVRDLALLGSEPHVLDFGFFSSRWQARCFARLAKSWQARVDMTSAFGKCTASDASASFFGVICSSVVRDAGNFTLVVAQCPPWYRSRNPLPH